MPNRRGRKKGKAAPRSQPFADRVETVPISIVQSFAAFTTGQISLDPTTLGGSRGAELADVFALYRVIKLKFRIISRVTTSTIAVAACYIPGVTDTFPSTPANVSTIPGSIYLSLVSGNPSGWCNVPKSQLASYETWYKTIAGTTDVAQEIQGNICVAANSAATVDIQILALYQFRGPVPIGSTPQARRDAADRAAWKQHLAVLAAGARLMGVSTPAPPSCVAVPMPN